MKERHPFSGNPCFELVGTKEYNTGPIIETNYFFKGWIPMIQFTNGYRPEYVIGWAGKETKIKTQGVKPATIIEVSEDQT